MTERKRRQYLAQRGPGSPIAASRIYCNTNKTTAIPRGYLKEGMFYLQNGTAREEKKVGIQHFTVVLTIVSSKR